MAISNLALNMMLVQHKKRPLEGPVMQLGRQRIDMSLEEAVKTFEEHGLTPNLDLLSSVQEKLLAADRSDHMSDFEFFSLFGITDIVAEDHLTEAERAERGSYVGCIAGALSMSQFRDGLEAVGLADVSVTPTHAVAEEMHSAIVRATRPA